MNHTWQNIGRKLPLLTTALLSMTVLTVSATAYREMRGSLVAAAGRRVVDVSQELARGFGASNDRLKREGSPLSRDLTLKEALLHGDSLSLAAAEKRLARERADNAQVVSVDLWTNGGGQLLLAGRPIPLTSPSAGARSATPPSPVGPLVAVHDTILSEVRLPILRGAGDTLGFVREFSRVSSAESKRLLSGLIGTEAVLLVGNRSGDVWTNLSGRVDGPLASQTFNAMVRSRAANGQWYIGAFSAVPGTPWLVWVALPESVVIAQARAFLWRMLLVSLVVGLLGAVGASRISRHLIGPITEVTRAAEGLARGNYSARATVARRDEAGRLADAFNSMATAIEAAQRDLEGQRAELEMQQVALVDTNEELCKNVDEAMAARRAAERSQARARAIIDGAIGAVILVERGGAIVEFNPAAQLSFGCSAAEAMGQRIDAFLPTIRDGQGHVDLDAYLALQERQPATATSEVTALRANGSEFFADFAMARIPMPDAPLFACFLRDLSERKQLEAQLRHSQKMEAVGTLAGGVAHDFNNMLTVMITYTDLMLMDADVPEHLRDDLVQVREAADRASALTRQLLAFSRKQVLHPVALNINDVVDNVSTMLTRILPSNIQLTTSLSESELPIRVDRGQLEQVLMNLAVNARDAMPDGGSLLIETATAMLDGAYVSLHPSGSPGAYVLLSVHDTGIGMDADTRARIFEPFFTTKAVGEGTGLGLATVYGIVQQSGGSVYVYSEPGHGTIFKVYFPIHGGGLEEDEESQVTENSISGPLRVLVVEDDAAVRDATELVLEHLGHHVVSVPSVAAALEILHAEVDQFDAVLTDAVMPGRSGLELAEILNAERPDLAIVLMSGYTEAAVGVGRSMPRGAVFVEKPFTGASIGSALAEALSATRCIDHDAELNRDHSHVMGSCAMSV